MIFLLRSPFLDFRGGLLSGVLLYQCNCKCKQCMYLLNGRQLPSCMHLVKSPEDGVWLPTQWGNWKQSHTKSSHPMDRTCTCTCTSMGAHTGWPSECSAGECHSNNSNNNWVNVGQGHLSTCINIPWSASTQCSLTHSCQQSDAPIPVMGMSLQCGGALR